MQEEARLLANMRKLVLRLTKQRDAIDRRIATLQAVCAQIEAMPAPETERQYVFSAAARARMSEGQRARHAKARAARQDYVIEAAIAKAEGR